jgi:hypothetical protein
MVKGAAEASEGVQFAMIRNGVLSFLRFCLQELEALIVLPTRADQTMQRTALPVYISPFLGKVWCNDLNMTPWNEV